MKALLILIAIITAFNPLMFKSTQQEESRSLQNYADQCGLSEEEFVLFSSVVEAESNRQAPEEGELTTEGRVMIALAIWNRVESDRWPDTVTGVLTQRGQFSTVRNGSSVTNRTEWSDQAVIEACEWLQEGDAPDVQFFNCRGFFRGYPAYECIGGNYFSLGVQE